MKILLVGGCGYVGSALHPYLVTQGHTVDTVDLELRGNKTNPRNLAWDYRMLGRLELERYDAVVHLAGHSSVAACRAEPYPAIKNNLSGVLDLLPRMAGQPFYYASSASVLSEVHNTIYDGTKRACEALIPALYPNSYGLRFGTVCGVAPNMRSDMILPMMVRSALATGKVVCSNPDAFRPVLGTRDLCRQLSALLPKEGERDVRGMTEVGAPAMAPGVYNLASFTLSIGEIAEQVADACDAKLVMVEGQPTYDIAMESAFPAEESVATIVPQLIEVL